jgi:hypothetical protein
MTLRELLKILQAQDEKSLDQHVFITPPPPGGGYAGIDHVSVMYVGNVVLHMLTEGPKLTEKGKELFAAVQPKK